MRELIASNQLLTRGRSTGVRGGGVPAGELPQTKKTVVYLRRRQAPVFAYARGACQHKQRLTATGGLFFQSRPRPQLFRRGALCRRRSAPALSKLLARGAPSGPRETLRHFTAHFGNFCSEPRLLHPPRTRARRETTPNNPPLSLSVWEGKE